MCEQVFQSLDKDGNGSITLEDSIWAKPFLDAHDIDGDGRVTLVREPAHVRAVAAEPAAVGRPACMALAHIVTGKTF